MASQINPVGRTSSRAAALESCPAEWAGCLEGSNMNNRGYHPRYGATRFPDPEAGRTLVAPRDKRGFWVRPRWGRADYPYAHRRLKPAAIRILTLRVRGYVRASFIGRGSTATPSCRAGILRAADGGKQQRIRRRRDDTLDAWDSRHRKSGRANQFISSPRFCFFVLPFCLRFVVLGNAA
jgi:hypothetical protein